MSAPVDVLAVMDEAAKDYADSSIHSSYENEMREARAAVAELVEAARDPLVTEMPTDGNWQARKAAVDRLRAALAAFGGGQ